MGKTIRIKRGYDIRLTGAAKPVTTAFGPTDIMAVKTEDYPQIKPKVIVSPGDTIQAGQCLFTDKLRPELQFTSPISGEVAEVVLGAKRRPMEVRILPDKDNIQYKSFPVQDPGQLTRDDVVSRLLESGCWSFLRQRPYSIIARPEDTPKAIFISCFDSSPLAPDLSYVIGQDVANFQTGLKALRHLAPKMHLSSRSSGSSDLATWLAGIDAHTHVFDGPHPAGNVGIQIHHIDPIRPGEIVWVIHPQDVMIIGRLFAEGRYRPDRIVALTGSHIREPQYFHLPTGYRLGTLLEGRTQSGEQRVIQGNVLHGTAHTGEDFLSAGTNQITVIAEGGEPEFLGWMLPGFGKLSLSRTYFSWLFPNRTYSPDTRINGEHRAFVMTGQYDRVLPMNIYPVFLLKAILAKDVEKMEKLGIYEVAEEDFALCEFVCTSKIEVQQIIREGLDIMQKEG